MIFAPEQVLEHNFEWNGSTRSPAVEPRSAVADKRPSQASDRTTLDSDAPELFGIISESEPATTTAAATPPIQSTLRFLAISGNTFIRTRLL